MIGFEPREAYEPEAEGAKDADGQPGHGKHAHPGGVEQRRLGGAEADGAGVRRSRQQKDRRYSR